MAATRANQMGGSDYTSGSLREDLANFITLVSPEKTPHLSMLSTGVAKQPRHEWQIDTLVDPADNAQSGSYEFATANNVVDQPDRLANYTQVFAKTVHIEGSLMRSDIAGAKNAFAYSTNKRKKEIARDIERQHLKWYDNEGASNANAVAMAYNTGDTRHMAGLSAYAGIVTNVGATLLQEVTGTSAGTNITGSNNGNPISRIDSSTNFGGTVVTSDGSSAITNVALTLNHLNSTFQEISENGGMVNTAQVPTGLKVHVSNLLINGASGAAQRRADEMASKLNLAVDTVMTEFGYTIDIVSNYIMANHAQDASSVIFMYDSSALKRSVLAPFEMKEDLSARYGKGAIIVCDETLEVRDPASVAMVVNATS